MSTVYKTVEKDCLPAAEKVVGMHKDHHTTLIVSKQKVDALFTLPDCVGAALARATSLQALCVAYFATVRACYGIDLQRLKNIRWLYNAEINLVEELRVKGGNPRGSNLLHDLDAAAREYGVAKVDSEHLLG